MLLLATHPVVADGLVSQTLPLTDLLSLEGNLDATLLCLDPEGAPILEVVLDSLASKAALSR